MPNLFTGNALCARTFVYISEKDNPAKIFIYNFNACRSHNGWNSWMPALRL